jgi:hypothetical protein
MIDGVELKQFAAQARELASKYPRKRRGNGYREARVEGL